MPGLLPHVDPDGLLEYSVVYTDRALNHMSKRFVDVMQDVIGTLKQVYNAHAVAIIPGSGTFGMEAVARQFANKEKVLIVRNGFFSFRWSQIFEAGQFGLSEGTTVLKARPQSPDVQAPWAPAPIEEVVASIRAEKPKVVFAPHCETASGILLPDAYVRAMAAAAHEVGALMVLDCIASGTLWIDMKQLGVDVVISAPQKGWSSTPCCAMVMLSERAHQAVQHTQSSSYACDLKKWLQIAEGYENGQHAYYTTMPTDGLRRLRDTMAEMRAIGFETLRERQIELGAKVRALLESRGFPSVAAAGVQSPGVVVSYTTDPDIQNGKKFAEAGLQAASGVPLMCDEGAAFRTFRLGLFGIDKWQNVDQTVTHLQQALDKMAAR